MFERNLNATFALGITINKKTVIRLIYYNECNSLRGKLTDQTFEINEIPSHKPSCHTFRVGNISPLEASKTILIKIVAYP